MASEHRRDRETAATRLYVRVVEQARLPLYYLAHGVPDTPDGRFDMIAVHAALLLRRLRRDHERTEQLAQTVFDLMFADMDQNLREMGVGDLAVGKRIKRMAQGFYGRLAAYEAGLADPSDRLLKDALLRNVYRHGAPGVGQLDGLATYVRHQGEWLDAISTERLCGGALDFAPAEAAVGQADARAWGPGATDPAADPATDPSTDRATDRAR